MSAHDDERYDADTAPREVQIPSGPAVIHADLTVPDASRGIVVFAHGSGSGRHSRRNRQVASALQTERLATLLVDLLTEDEASRDERTAELRFDIELLARRVVDAIDWIAREPAIRDLTVGIFGASTGAAAALFAAVHRPGRVRAVVSRGGRPDLAAPVLAKVEAPTMLIVGGDDTDVLALNENAFAQLRCESVLEIVPGASHLFEEPGALEAVAELAGAWFTGHLDPTLGQPGVEP